MANKLLTQVLTIDELKSLYIETFLNHTNNVSKVSNFAVLNAHAYGSSKLAQKVVKDTAILESQIFPNLSSGTYLDNAAKLVGGIARLSATASSTFVLVYAAQGTIYVPGVSSFTSNQGVSFDIVSQIIIDINGYAYIPVRSSSTGVNTNVDAFTINTISNPPIGHISCTNEYASMGGSDSESDEDFKQRLLTFQQFAATITQDNILANLQNINSNIISVKKIGFSSSGKVQLMLVTANGQYFTADELTGFTTQLANYLSLSDVDIQGSLTSLEFVNPVWHQVGGTSGVDFRLSIASGFTESTVRSNIQVRLTKYFDFRYWNQSKIQWVDLFEIVQSTAGVSYVSDEYFYPGSDEAIEPNRLPRVIKFIMRDLNGNILFNNNSNIGQIYYPSGL